MTKTQRLDKILGNMGYGSRRELKEILKKGRVKVDDVVIKDGSQHVHPLESIIEIDGKILVYKEFIYIMMNKPQGVISASFDPKAKTVVHLLSEAYQAYKPFPVGRLDKDTEGLLLLTNDGKLAHELLAPKKHVPKTYYAKIEGKVEEEDCKAFSQGVVLEDGYKTLPAQLNIIKSEAISEIMITIYEGKFHQVKRMFEARNKKVIYLKRISMGSLLLDESLNLGEYRELAKEELELLQKQGDK